MSSNDITPDDVSPGPDAPQMTYEAFKPHVGSLFHMPFEDGQDLQLKLVEATSLEHLPRTERVAFSLLFHGPKEPCLEQMAYHLRHDALGPLVLFLVPLQSDDLGTQYEAVFT